MDKERKSRNMYFKFRKSQDVREEILGRAQATKRSSMELSVTLEGKWTPLMVQRFKETGHPVFTSASALSRGILRRVMGKDSIHFSTDASITVFLSESFTQANQLSIYGAVSNWCEEFGLTSCEKEHISDMSASKQNEKILKSVNAQEVNSLVRSPRKQQASGN